MLHEPFLHLRNLAEYEVSVRVAIVVEEERPHPPGDALRKQVTSRWAEQMSDALTSLPLSYRGWAAQVVFAGGVRQALDELALMYERRAQQQQGTTGGRV